MTRLAQRRALDPDRVSDADDAAFQARVLDALTAILQLLERPRVQADERLHRALVARIGAGHAFSAAEVLRFAATDPPLAQALESSGLRTVQRVGRRLGRLGRAGYVRLVGRNHEGAIWALNDVVVHRSVTTSST